jgi:hypothetical protein
MSSAFSQRTPAFPLSVDGARGGRKGSISVTVTLMFLVFTVLGLGMLLLSQVHLKAGASRKNSALLDYAAENGIKRALEDIDSALASRATLIEVSPGRMSELRSDALLGGTKIVEELFDWPLPRLIRETWEDMSWESVTACDPERTEDREDFLSVSYRFRIDSEGKLVNFKPKRASQCDASLYVLAGRLPLPCVPLLLNKKMDAGTENDFLSSKGISFRTAPGGSPDARLEVVETPVIPTDATSLLGQALRIRLFRPEDLDDAAVRRAVGLEPSNDPVPDGVYLIQDDLGLGGVFVQGDIEELVTAIDGPFQVICFRSEAGEWVLRFSPSLRQTFFTAPDASRSYDLVPVGIIAVNGKIGSLGGGTMDASGRVVMAGDEATPSILAGVSLTILSSEGVTISTHLISQGVRWQDGVPYVKDGSSQVIIYSTGKDFLEGTTAEGGISIAEGAPDNLTIQASLIAGGTGFTIQGEGKDIEVLGGIQAVDYTSEGNTLRISPDRRLAEGLSLPENTPLSTVPMLYVSSFRVREWMEY